MMRLRTRPFLKKDPKKGSGTKEDEMAARSDAILTAIRNNPTASRPTLAKELNLTDKQVRTAIERLKFAGIIHYEGIGKNGHWVMN